MMKSIVLVVVAVFALAAPAAAWGTWGHRITAAVAQNYLSDKALAQVKSVLAKYDGKLSQVATWADEIKHDSAYRWSGMLHYADADAWVCKFTMSDCPDGDQCVVGAIANYTRRLMNPTDSFDSEEALKFLVHFLGDIHQPLHVGFKSDKGGNELIGAFNHRKSNLHAVWDEYIIAERVSHDYNNDDMKYESAVIKMASSTYKKEISKWMKCAEGCAETIASETARIACDYAYTDADGSKIQDGYDLELDYYERTIPVVEEQLVKGGVRLAALLNFIFESEVVVL